MTKRLEIQTDQHGLKTCGNYTIESWKREDGTIKSYSVYNRFNSMYDNKDGFKSPEDAAEWINKYRGR